VRAICASCAGDLWSMVALATIAGLAAATSGFACFFEVLILST